jgi:acetoin utilization protein AcuB
MAKTMKKVRDYMSRDPATVGPKESLQRVIELLRRRDVRSVAVLDGEQLIGIVTDRDVRQVAPAFPLIRDESEIRHYTDNLTVTAAMTANPMTIAAADSLSEAAKILETYRISSLPVLDQQKFVGILSVADILRAFVEQSEEVAV